MTTSGKPKQEKINPKNEQGYQSQRVKDIDGISTTSHTFYDKISKVDWPSLSDIGLSSPEFSDIGSDNSSSGSSLFSWADIKATENVIEEWNKIERTLYDEDGPKVQSKSLIDECKQWQIFFPHLRVCGRSIKTYYKDINEESITPSVKDIIVTELNNNGFTNNQLQVDEKPNFSDKIITSRSEDLIHDFNNIFHVQPVILSPNIGNKSSILRSEILSSRWSKQDLSPQISNSFRKEDRVKSNTSILSKVNILGEDSLRNANVKSNIIKKGVQECLKDTCVYREFKNNNVELAPSIFKRNQRESDINIRLNSKQLLPPISANNKCNNIKQILHPINAKIDTLAPLNLKRNSILKTSIYNKIQRFSSNLNKKQ